MDVVARSHNTGPWLEHGDNTAEIFGFTGQGNDGDATF